MVSQEILIGVAVGLFFAGLGIGYAASQSTTSPMMMSSQQIMNDHKQMNQWMNIMMGNPQQMQKIITSTMQDSDQMQMMEDLMADMMQRMQTDPELEQAMMEHMNRMNLSRDTMMDTKTNSSSELQQEKVNLENEFSLCTSDWYITGYFLPIESEYSGKTVEIYVDKVKQFYLADFLEAVTMEGWGRTNSGNYLGWYNDAFTISDRYLDAYDTDLIVGMIAVNDSVIKHGSELTIPTLPEPWNDMVFSGSDEGPSINGKHIDVFTGEGIDAENETFRSTSDNNKVCMQN